MGVYIYKWVYIPPEYSHFTSRFTHQTIRLERGLTEIQRVNEFRALFNRIQTKPTREKLQEETGGINRRIERRREFSNGEDERS